MSNVIIPKEHLTAYQRWELGSFDQNKSPEKGTPTAKGAPLNLPTAEEVEHIHHDAHRQGYAAGYEEGTARARMEAMHLNTLVEQLDGALAEFDQQVAERLLALAVEIARQVVRQSIATRPALMLEVVREALLQLPHQHAAIHLHPEDAALMRAHLGDQLAHNGHRIFEEPSIARGGVRIEAGGSHLDATLETRWRRVVESMGATGEWIETQPEPGK